jgi:hypothetical protein
MLLKYLAYAFVLLIYGAFAWTGKVSADSFIAVLGGVIAALGATHIHSAVSGSNDAPSLPPAALPQAPATVSTLVTQSGFASPALLLLMAIAVIASLCLSGCANVTQAASAYNTSGMVAARAAEDLNIQIWKENACGTPLSTIVRHPEIAGGLKALCLSASTSSANELLGQIGPGSVPATAPSTTPGVQSADASGTQK